MSLPMSSAFPWTMFLCKLSVDSSVAKVLLRRAGIVIPSVSCLSCDLVWVQYLLNQVFRVSGLLVFQKCFPMCVFGIAIIRVAKSTH